MEGIQRLYPRMILGVVAVSFGAILVRFASEASPLAISAWRLTLASLVLVPVAWIQRKRTLTPRMALWCLASGAALALHFVLWTTSLNYTSIASSVLFVTTHPLFVGLGSFLFLKERPSRRLILGISIAILGGALIGFGDIQLAGTALRGDVLAVGGGLMAAIYFMIGRHVRQIVSATEYVAVTYGMAAVMLLAVCVITHTPAFGFSASTIGFLVLLALIPQLLGHSTFNWALKHVSASHVSIMILGEPVGAGILALIFFSEVPSGLNLIGAALILGGIYLSLRNKERTHVH
ncbi:DMT family transporter [Candidatus Bipolaricaulota bacterium]|nr:DMT family transporter [Candidatus Bipolaricaulota bacterium]